MFTNLLPTLQEFIKCLRALYASQLKLHINSKQFNLIPYEDKIIIMFSHQYSRVTDNHIDLRFAIDEDTGLITKLTLINTLSENCDDYHIIDIPQTPYEVHVDLENYCWSGVSIQQQLEFNIEDVGYINYVFNALCNQEIPYLDVKEHQILTDGSVEF